MLIVVIVLLTLSTAYIHYWVGGWLLVMNAAGYVGLAAAVLGSALFYRRALPLVLVGVAMYAAATIVGWLVVGPYFDVAYVAKGLEIALIATIGLQLSRTRDDVHAAIGWARHLIHR